VPHFPSPATLCRCFRFSHFPPLHFGAVVSFFAISTPAFLTVPLFHVSHFKSIRSLVSEIGKFKKLSLKLHFIFQYVNAHWLLDELPMASVRGPGEMKKRKFSDKKMHQIRIFHFELRAAVNPLRPGPPKIRRINCCHCQLRKQWRNVHVFVDMILFTKQNRILLTFWMKDKCHSAKQLLKEFCHTQWSRLSFEPLLREQRVFDLLYWQLGSPTDTF